MAALFSVYTDVPDLLANLSIPAVEVASLVGLNTTLSVGVSLGATALSVGSVSGAPTSGTFTAYILDASGASERVSASVSGSALSVPAGTLAAHSAGVSVSSAGVGGCLADVIQRASAKLEAICKQGPEGGSKSLWQASRTETLSGPNQYRAAIDHNQVFTIKPYRFPIISVSGVSLQIGAQASSALDTSFLVIPDGARTLSLPAPNLLTSSAQTVLTQRWPRNVPFWITLTYVGGPCAGPTLDTVPSDIREALYLLVLDYLGFRVNQYGMTMVRRGDVSYTHAAHTRGDAGAEGLFTSQAKSLLEPYRADL
jgi:hypothetical protein